MKRYTGYLLAGVVLITALISPCSAGVACPFNTAIIGTAVTPFSLINPPAITVSPFEGQMGSGDVSPFPDTGDGADPPCPFEGQMGSGDVSPFPDTGDGADPPCPFEGQMGNGDVSPFPDTGDGADPPCPFEGQMGSGDVSPFPDTGDGADPPCPFPRIPFLTGEMSGTDTVGETGYYPPPTDPDGDGFYEDLNGNGSVDYADLVLYINTIDWIQENEPLSCFDYDRSGNIDRSDLMFLFEKI